MQDPQPGDADYASEVRFGVVMYGGVSLAIYINGVANEMYEMACATPRAGGAREPATSPNAPMTSREVYRRLSWLVGNPELCERYARAIEAEKLRARAPGASPADAWDERDTVDLARTRLVVDVVAGTSAGGINGIFLAKALANGESFSPLRDMWVNEGDIGLLLNDERSCTVGFQPPLVPASGEPASLLNSDRMYMKLLEAMRTMPPVASMRRSDGASPLVDEIDLFVTTTDIVGAPVPLRLADKVVYERRHKQNYRFVYPTTTGGNDFAAENNPFLAFAARCTSSFPFAFEPMTLNTLTRLKTVGDVSEGIRHWDRFFAGLPKKLVGRGDHLQRAFGDGGYLDNKPFTYVVEALSQRQAGVPIERKLIYVEPSPQHLDADESTPSQPPDALSNALAALTSIPQYETIREDLQSVLRRNQRIERVENLVRLSEAAIERHTQTFERVQTQGDEVSPWATLKLSHLVEYYGVAFLPYSRLRVFALTDKLAEGLAELWGVDRESDHLYALRALVRFWRETKFDDEAGPGDAKQTVTAFLDQFDIDYRLRRLRFLQRKIDQTTRVLRLRRRDAVPFARLAEAGNTALSDIDRKITAGLAAEGFRLEDEALPTEAIDRALAVLRVLKRSLVHVRTRLQRHELAARAEHARKHPLSDERRGQLIGVLNLLLDSQATSSDPPLRLDMLQGGEVRVLIPQESLRASSASRTMQESVVLRVRGLFQAAGKAGKTRLHQDLEDSLEAMRLKRDPRNPAMGDPPANAISGLAWALLGKPELKKGDDGKVALHTVDVEPLVDAGQPLCTAAELQWLNAPEGALLRRFFAGYYLRFDAFDQMSFPLYYDTGTGEPATVDIIRVSPEDAPSLLDERSDTKRKKLAGTKLFNFGAFLDERWRRNDIMWGRLDGAERLIKALLPMSDPATSTVRAELISRAHGSILREALVGQGHSHLTGLLCSALETLPDKTTEQRLATLLKELKAGDPVQQSRLQGVLMSLLSEQGLVDYVSTTHDVDRRFEPKSTFESAARAVTITGKVLDGITKRRGADTSLPRWMARAGLLLQGLAVVSVPGALMQRWWSHGLKLLYAFEILGVLLALLFGAEQARSLALTALVVTFLAHLSSLLVSDMMESRVTWRRWLLRAAIGAVLVSAVIGVTAIYTGAWRQVWTAATGA
jgi:patatin-related protein